MAGAAAALGVLAPAAPRSVPGTDRSQPPVIWSMNASAEFADHRLDAYDDVGLRAISRVGASELRWGASWASADPTGAAGDGRAPWDWTRIDGDVAEAAKNGLRWAPFVCYPPASRSRTPAAPCGGPTFDQGGYARFTAALAARYGTGGDFWSAHPKLPRLPIRAVTVWNEPNLLTVWPTVVGQPETPEEYAALFSRTRDEVAAAVGTRVKVNFAPPAPISDARSRPTEFGEGQFLRRAVAALRGGRVDAFEGHPYIAGVTAADPAGHTFEQVKGLRALLGSIGRGTTPLELSEIGVASSYAFLGDPGSQPEATVRLTEEERAQYYRQVIPALAASNCRITSVAPLYFSAPTAGNRATAGPEAGVVGIADAFAIADAPGRLRPAGEMYRKGVAAARFGRTPPGTIHLCD